MKNTFKSLTLAVIASAGTAFYSCTPSSSGNEAAETATNSKTYYVSENDTVNFALVNNYFTSLVNGDGSVAKNSVTPGYKSIGPAFGDTLSIDQEVEQWAKIATTRSNQNIGILAATGITATEEPYTGDWVYMWGIYSCTHNESGKDISVPWHYSVKIENGKIALAYKFYDDLKPAMEVGAVVMAD